MKIKVPYGRSFQEAEIPDSVNTEVIDPLVQPVKESVEAFIKDALDHPIGTPRLEDMVVPEDKITIVVNDQTRPGPTAQMAAEIVRRLKGAGVSEENMTFVIATGSHKGPNEEQLHTILGGLEKRIRVHIHDCLDGHHIYMGRTQTYDVPIYLDEFVAHSDFIVTTGLIAPHHSAGFSGGRKSIVPGVVDLKTLKVHHSLPIRPYEPAINFFEGNPFHKVALEAARLVKVRFILNMVQDVHKQIAGAVAGDLEQAHNAGVEICRKINTVEIDGRADLIITSPGGAPRDIDLWQSQKALSVAEMLAYKKGTTFILVAEAKNGIPQLFIDWMTAAKCPEEVIERYRRDGFDIGTNKAFMYARAMTKGKIILVTQGMTEEMAHRCMLDWAPDLQSAINKALVEKTPKKVIVLPRAVNIIPKIKEAE